MIPCFLIVAGVGLSLVSLTYGAAPGAILPKVLSVSIEGTDLTHVFRGVMGLYLGMSLFWVMSAFRPGWRNAAVVSVILFMAGLASGRVLSLILDGVPSRLLLIYLLVELGVACWGLAVLRYARSAA